MDQGREHVIARVHKHMEDFREGEVAIEVNLGGDARREETMRKKRLSKSKITNNLPSKHVHGGDWKDMINFTNSHQEKRSSNVSQTSSFHNIRPRAGSSTKSNVWIEHNLKKCECCLFVPSNKYSARCGCGRSIDQHPFEVQQTVQSHKFLKLPRLHVINETPNESDNHESIKKISNASKKPHGYRWTIARNTETAPTDAYGTIVFEGSARQSRAQFVRTSSDTEPATLSDLLYRVWKLPPPKLVITIHGGLTNFDLQPKLARIFRKGILKVARSTNAWIITSGLNAGVVPHIAPVFDDLGSSSRSRNRIIAIGVAPWGMLKGRSRFIGTDISVHYAPNQFSKSRLAELNDRHSYFIFADNGTVGRYGPEIILRKRIETYLAQQNSCSTPVVCVVLEGGAFTIKVVYDYVASIPHIPVVICDGSGGAADLLAFTHHALGEEGRLSDSVRHQLVSLVEMVLNCDENNSNRIVQQLIQCARQRDLMTVFRMGEQRQDVDHAVFTALLKGQNLSPSEQLQLALAWNRADIARSEIFTLETEWSIQDLHNAMMEALSNDRTDFVQLLLDNGVSMHSFLTFSRLEHLYNSDKGLSNTLRSKMGITSKKQNRIKLTDVGHVMEDLMGHAYKSNYTKEDFKAKYFVFSNRKQSGCQRNSHERIRSENLKEYKETEHSTHMDLLHTARSSIISIFGGRLQNEDDDGEFSHMKDESLDFTFKYPYSELLIWSVLTKRQKMAMLMWKHGEEAMAKSLVASRLYDSLANDASQNYLELEICDELRKNSEKFRKLSIELLQYCTEQDKDITLQLLTYELTNWGNETCLSLAALDNNREFLAHPCCQLLLSDLWQGGLNIRYNANLKVLGSLLIPVGIFMMEYKTKEELMLQPHTFAEHLEENSDSDTSLSGDTSYSDTNSSGSEEETCCDKMPRQDPNIDKEPLSLSFQQLMIDKLHSASLKDCVANGNGIVATSQNQRVRGRTMSTVKRQSEKGCTNDSISERNKSTLKKHVSTIGISRQIIRNTQRSISWRRKLREFYSAPITTFWIWSLSFYIFLIALSFSLLVKTERYPKYVEWYVISYVVVWLVELLRKLVMIVMIDRKQKIWRKVALYFGNYRNGVLLVATTTYTIAFFIRCNPSSRMVGRVLLVCNSMLWSLKLLDYLRVFRQLGPYITMAAEMIPRMLPILSMLFVSLLAFGLVREAITYPYENWHWLLVRNIFYKPYFMLYGEVYAPEIDTCGDAIWENHREHGSGPSNSTSEKCVPGYFIAPLFMTVFMLISNVLLMNTMVACGTYVFEHNVENTQEIWLFERYSQVMEYDSTPFIPPPFTIFYHAFWLFRWMRVRKFSRKNLLDASLKLFLSEEQIEKIHSFEEECVEDMEREKDILKQSSNDERIHHVAERSDQILNRLNVFENVVRADVRNLGLLLKAIEARHKDEMDALKQMNSRLPRLLRILSKRTFSELSESESPEELTSEEPLKMNRRERYNSADLLVGNERTSGIFPVAPTFRRSSPHIAPTIVVDQVDSEEDEKCPILASEQSGLLSDEADIENEII